MDDQHDPDHPLRKWRPEIPADRLQRPRLVEQLQELAGRAEALARDLRATAERAQSGT